jgi:hypothetical protein
MEPYDKSKACPEMIIRKKLILFLIYLITWVSLVLICSAIDDSRTPWGFLGMIQKLATSVARLPFPWNYIALCSPVCLAFFLCELAFMCTSHVVKQRDLLSITLGVVLMTLANITVIGEGIQFILPALILNYFGVMAFRVKSDRRRGNLRFGAIFLFGNALFILLCFYLQVGWTFLFYYFHFLPFGIIGGLFVGGFVFLSLSFKDPRE